MTEFTQGETIYIASPANRNYAYRSIFFYALDKELVERGLIFKTEEAAVEVAKKMVQAIGGNVC